MKFAKNQVYIYNFVAKYNRMGNKKILSTNTYPTMIKYCETMKWKYEFRRKNIKFL